MKSLSGMAASFALITLLLLTGCATNRPIAYTGLASAPQMQPNVQEDANHRPYVYQSSDVAWNDYASLIIEPVTIYNDADHQFGDLAQSDKRELAQYMSAQFGKQLSKRFTLVRAPAPRTLRLKLTLTGAKTNTAVISTFTRFDLVGLPYNAIQSARGKEGMFMGSVSYSVEIYDAMSNRLLEAFVAKQHPNAMNVVATVGSLNAAKTGIEKGAEQLLRDLQ